MAMSQGISMVVGESQNFYNKSMEKRRWAYKFCPFYRANGVQSILEVLSPFQWYWVHFPAVGLCSKVKSAESKKVCDELHRSRKLIPHSTQTFPLNFFGIVQRSATDFFGFVAGLNDWWTSKSEVEFIVVRIGSIKFRLKSSPGGPVLGPFRSATDLNWVQQVRSGPTPAHLIAVNCTVPWTNIEKWGAHKILVTSRLALINLHKNHLTSTNGIWSVKCFDR